MLMTGCGQKTLITSGPFQSAYGSGWWSLLLPPVKRQDDLTACSTSHSNASLPESHFLPGMFWSPVDNLEVSVWVSIKKIEQNAHFLYNCKNLHTCMTVWHSFLCWGRLEYARLYSRNTCAPRVDKTRKQTNWMLIITLLVPDTGSRYLTRLLFFSEPPPSFGYWRMFLVHF